MSDPFAAAAESAAALARATGVARHDVCVVLGSGWARAADAIGLGTTVAFDDLPGFPPPSAGGHVAAVRSIDLGQHRVLVFLGRLHLYEGHDGAVVAHPVRVAAAAGLPHRDPHQRRRVPEPRVVGRSSRADQRPHQPHRPVAAHRDPSRRSARATST